MSDIFKILEEGQPLLILPKGSDEKKAVAEALFYIKEALKLPWKEIAEILKVDQATLTRWKSGKTRPRKTQLRRLRQLKLFAEKAALIFPAAALQDFLHRYNDNFGKSPLQLLKEGNEKEIEELIYRLNAIIEGIPL